MADYNVTIRGLNTETYPHRLASGTADAMINAIIEGRDVTRREGFAVLEDDIKGDAAEEACLSMTAEQFADGDVYIACKLPASLWRRKIYPSDEGSFSEITTGWTHHATDRGWWFMWGDRLHYIDRSGGSRWNPDVNSGTAYKAGLRRPSTGPLIGAVAGGEKDGHYHVHMAYYNSAMRERGVITAAQSDGGPPLECRIDTSTSGIGISNWSTIRAQDTDYEWTHADFFCTFGNTEYIGKSPGVECFSYKAYLDVRAAKNQLTVGMNKADHVLNTQEYVKNSGGEPPGARYGCYDGHQAVYGGIAAGTEASLLRTFAGENNDLTFTAAHPGEAGNEITVTFTTGASLTVSVAGTDISVQIIAATTTANQVVTAVSGDVAASNLVTVAATEGTGEGTIPGGAAKANLTGGAEAGGSQVQSRIDFSIPGFPTMVPREHSYNIGGDATTITPKPWIGSIISGVTGEVKSFAAGGGTIFAFTPTSTVELVRGDAERLVAVLRHASIGCTGEAACVGTPEGAYYLGHESFCRARRGGWGDLAEDRLHPTLREIPAAYRDEAVAGWFSHARQIWLAVTKAGGTKNQRILIYDQGMNEFLIFEPGCLGTRATLSTNDAGDTNNDLTFTAEAPGAPGNSVTVAYTSGGTAGSESVSVSGSAITVQIAVGTSTAAQVMAAFNKSGDAVALATCTLKTGNNGTGVVSEVMGPTSLSGGGSDEGITAMCEMAVPNADPVMLLATDKGRILKYPGSVQAAVVIDPAGANNSLTFTALVAGPSGTNITIAYTTGGTAGSETVTVDGTAISIDLEAGVSTATQVIAAVEADASASGLVTVANTGSDTGGGTIPAAVGATSLSGGSGAHYDDTVGYAARWRGYFGQENVERDQYLNQLSISPASNVADSLRLGFRGMRLAGEVRPQSSVVLHKDLLRTPLAVRLGKRDGNLFQIEFFSPHSVVAQWSVRDVSMQVRQKT